MDQSGTLGTIGDQTIAANDTARTPELKQAA